MTRRPWRMTWWRWAWLGWCCGWALTWLVLGLFFLPLLIFTGLSFAAIACIAIRTASEY